MAMPRRFEGEELKPLRVGVPESMFAQIKALAKEKDRSISWLGYEAFKEYLAKETHG